MEYYVAGLVKMAELLRKLVAPVDHGCVYLRDAESRSPHLEWDPATSNVSLSGDSVLFAVQPSVDGHVVFEIYRGRPERALAETLFEGPIKLAHGRIVMHDPNEDFRLEIPELGHGGEMTILVDDVNYPASVQIVLRFLRGRSRDDC